MKDRASCVMRRVSRQVVRAVFAAAVFADFGSAWADIPASAYVQDGLIAQWDGIENAGAGQPHDPTAAYPKELVSGIAQTLTGTMAAGDNYFTLGAGYTTFKLPAMITAINAGHATIEMRISRDTSVGLVADAGFVGFGSTSPNRAFWLWQSKSDFVSGYSYFAKDGQYDVTLKYNEASPNTLAFQLGATATDSAWLVNGVRRAGLNRWTTETAVDDDCHIGRLPRYSMATARMHALRLYTRKLTDVEVARNAVVDRLRFDGADPEDVGYRWNSEAGKLEYRVVVRALDGGTLTIGDEQGLAAATNWVTFGESFDVHATAVPAEGQRFVIWRGNGVPDAQKTAAEIRFTANAPVDIAAKFIADGAPYWTFDATAKTITHSSSGLTLKAERVTGGLTLAGYYTTPGSSEIDLSDPIYPPDFSEDLPLVEVKASAFKNNTDIQKIILPDTVTTIGNDAFNTCPNLAFVRLSANLVSIGQYAFTKGTVPRYFEPEMLPASVTTIGSQAFASSKETNTVFRVSNPGYSTYSGGSIDRCTGFKVIDYRGATFTRTDDLTAYGNTSLQEIYFPATLCAVGSGSSFNWLGGMSSLKRIYFSGPPVKFEHTSQNPLGQNGSPSMAWYVPKWNKDWEAYFADPDRCLLTEMDSAACKNYVTGHPGEPLPVLRMQMGTASSSYWAGSNVKMGLCFWYPDPPPTYEPVAYFDILGWEQKQPTVDAANATLFDGTVWTACNEHGAFVWTGDGTPVVYELGADCTAARGLKFTGYRLHQACITKDSTNVQLMPNGRAPTAWTLEGRTKGGEWVTLDTQTMTAASEKHWAYFDYGTYSETVPARTSCSLEYAIAVEKQDCYTAFRFTPTASHNSEAGTDATPYSLMEIEFIGLVTTAEPVIGAFAVNEPAWNSIDFTVTVLGFGDDNVKDQHATSAKAWVEVSETDDFSAPVAVGEKVDAALGTAQTLTVGGLDGNHAYHARVVVSNDFDLAVCKTLEGTVSTLSSPFALGELTAGADEDDKLTVDFAIDKLYADSATVTLFYAAQVGGAYGQVKSMTVTAAGPVDFGTLDVEPLPTSTVKVEVRVGDNVESRETSVFAVWTVDAAGGVLRHSKSGATFNMTLTGDAIALGKAVSLGDATAFDFTIPIVDANGAYRLTALNGTFDSAKNITEVILPDTVTEIGAKTFFMCEKLAKVRLSNALVTIGSEAFSGCTALSDLSPRLPASVRTIGDKAFYDCRLLSHVVIPEGVTVIPSSCFYNCLQLADVTIPESCTTIGGSAFTGDSVGVFTNVFPRVLPHGITSIGGNAFRCLSAKVPLLILDNPGLTSIGGGAFYGRSFGTVDLSQSSFGGFKNGHEFNGGYIDELILPPCCTNLYNPGNGVFGTVRKLRFTGNPPMVGTGTNVLDSTITTYYAPMDNEAWDQYLADHPEWVQPVTVADMTSWKNAMKKYFPGEPLRPRPSVMVKLNGISSFRPLVRYGKKGLMLLVR